MNGEIYPYVLLENNIQTQYQKGWDAGQNANKYRMQ